MDDVLDGFVRELIDEILEETKKTYGEAAFERWSNMRHMGRLDAPNGHALVDGGCGDTTAVFLRVENDRIAAASFQTEGCGASAVCCSVGVEMAFGKDVFDIQEITGEAILKRLEGLPGEELHCAFMAARAIHAAVDHYLGQREGNQTLDSQD